MCATLASLGYRMVYAAELDFGRLLAMYGRIVMPSFSRFSFMCPSCGNDMNSVRNIPAVSGLPELRTYEYKPSKVVNTEAVEGQRCDGMCNNRAGSFLDAMVVFQCLRVAISSKGQE
jgi:hypothetical protein